MAWQAAAAVPPAQPHFPSGLTRHSRLGSVSGMGVPPTSSRTAMGAVWLSRTEWSTFLSDASATLWASGAPPSAVHTALATIAATPRSGNGGWVVVDAADDWEAMGAAVARAMAAAPGGRGAEGRSVRCQSAAAPCAPYWNFSGCTSRRYCCCPPYCRAVFSSFGSLRIAAGRATGVHGCCVEAFC